MLHCIVSGSTLHCWHMLGEQILRGSLKLRERVTVRSGEGERQKKIKSMGESQTGSENGNITVGCEK